MTNDSRPHSTRAGAGVWILVPVYNDWEAASMLVEALDRELGVANRRAALLFVDDGAGGPLEDGERRLRGRSLAPIEILHLRANLGHQRAIAVGLAFLEQERQPDAVVVMDGDGEDLPQDVPRLLAALEVDHGERIVFAERIRRSEGFVFTALYALYRYLHLLLTGERVRVGNFAAVPHPLLHRIVGVSHLWNHFAAAVFHARLPFTTVPTVRGHRYAGKSQMSLVALTVHGLSAMSVFGERIGVRLLFVTGALAAIAIVLIAGLVVLPLTSGTPAPLVLALALMSIAMLAFTGLTVSLAFVFMILAGRGGTGFLPFRQYRDYISHVTRLPSDAHVELSLPGH